MSKFEQVYPNNQKVIVIVGPTAVGKSRLAVDLAHDYNAEIVSADSIQVYRGLNIGTAKPTDAEKQGIPHYMIDVVDPDYSYSVAEYNEQARAVISDILARDKTPIIVGGSGLYINSLIYDMDFSGEGGNDERRRELEILAETHGNEYIYDILKDMDQESAAQTHPNNRKRVIRMIERLEGALENDGARDFTDSFKPTKQFVPTILRMTMDRDALYERIELRVDEFISQGLLNEVKSLQASGVRDDAISLLGIGYKEIVAFTRGEYGFEEAVNLIKRNTRRFAKRQETWFKRTENAHILDVSGNNGYENAKMQAKELIDKFLESKE